MVQLYMCNTLPIGNSGLITQTDLPGRCGWMALDSLDADGTFLLYLF